MDIDRSEYETMTDDMFDDDACDDDICDTDNVDASRRRFHRDITLPTLQEIQKQRMDVISATDDPDNDYDRNRNHNHNGSNIQQEDSDSYDEEFAILEGQRRRRVPCTDYLKYWLY